MFAFSISITNLNKAEPFKLIAVGKKVIHSMFDSNRFYFFSFTINNTIQNSSVSKLLYQYKNINMIRIYAFTICDNIVSLLHLDIIL